MIKVFLADNHPIFTEGVQAILENVSGMQVVGVAFDGQEALSFLAKNPVDVALLDIKMPKKNGLEVCQIIRERFRNIKVILLTMYNERKLIEESLRLGANGYILKNEGKEELIKAIRNVCQNG